MSARRSLQVVCAIAVVLLIGLLWSTLENRTLRARIAALESVIARDQCGLATVQVTEAFRQWDMQWQARSPALQALVMPDEFRARLRLALRNRVVTREDILAFLARHEVMVPAASVSQVKAEVRILTLESAQVSRAQDAASKACTAAPRTLPKP